MFKPAVKEKLKARLAIEGPSGSGKTYSALLMATGLVGPEGKIAMIDTEQESGKLYADKFTFDHATLESPYTPERYINLIQMAEKGGYDCLIIDSISHEWMGTGGVLEIHDTMPGNSYTNWAKVNPRHNKFLETILKSPCHIIATMRSKQAYALETNDKGKQEPKKMGMAPQQRDGMEYEFTAVLKMDVTHMADGDKDRTGLFPSGEWFKPSVEHGEKLAMWLNSGIDKPVVPPTPQPQPQEPTKKLTAADWTKVFDTDFLMSSDKTAEAVKAWRLRRGKEIMATIASSEDADKLKGYLNEMEAEYTILKCPETDAQVTAASCAGKPCKIGCPEFTK